MITLDPLAFYSAKDVAQIVFGRGVQWFYLRRRALRLVDGFPKPVSTIGQPRWSGSALLAWSQREQFDGPREAKIVDLTAQLAARSRAIAAEGRFHRRSTSGGTSLEGTS